MNEMPMALDLVKLEELFTSFGEDSAHDLLRTYLEDSSLRIREVSAGLEARDWQRIRYSIHQLKSSTNLVGASLMAFICCQIEELQGDAWPPAAAWIEKLRTADLEVRPRLEQRLLERR